MGNAPERIWFTEVDNDIVPNSKRTRPEDVEYVRADLAALEAAEADAHALVAEACEEMVNQAVDMADGRDEAAYIEDRMRDAIPALAIAARDARDEQVREQALREAASHFIEQDIADEILALIEGNQTDE